MLFPCYTTSFSYKGTAAQVIALLQRMADDPDNCVRLKPLPGTDEGVLLRKVTVDLLTTNSDAPDAAVRFRKVNGTTKVSVLFGLKKSVRIIIAVQAFAALVMSVLAFCLGAGGATGILFLWIAAGYVASHIGLLACSKSLLKTLWAALGLEGVEPRPPIFKVVTKKDLPSA